MGAISPPDDGECFVNFTFKVGDVVVLRGASDEMLLVREFVTGVFHAKRSDGSLLRVRSSQLLRVRRPSDEARAAEVAARKALKATEIKSRLEHVTRNQRDFEEMEGIGIRLTAKGLPDKRCKPRYRAENAPLAIKPRGRSNLP